MNKEHAHIPKEQIPICIIGAGGIVKDAHLPAYKIAGFKVAGITNRNRAKAEALAQQFGIEKVYDSLTQMIAEQPGPVVYDLALPASEIIPTLQLLPQNACVLIQKPLGESLAQAKEIVQLVHRKNMLAGVNFQMRFAPFMMQARRLINQGLLGQITDVEVYVNVYTPWHLWDFLHGLPRMEINYHSVHYIDLVRSLLGEPQKIIAHSFQHPQALQLSSTRSNIIMDYGPLLRAAIHTNHHHHFGYKNQQSYVKIEGTTGAVKINYGALINYPHGVPDAFEYCIKKEGETPDWQTVALTGTWFPHAFIGTMEQMLLALTGRIATPENSVEDGLRTMACVEAACLSHERDGINPLGL